MMQSSSTPMVELRHLLPAVFSDAELRAEYAASDIWLRPSVTINTGERLLVRAASGRGKSSLCSFLCGRRRDFEGSLLIEGRDSAELSEEEWSHVRCNLIAWLPQDIGLFPTLTAMENIEIKRKLTSGPLHRDIEEYEAMLDGLGIDPHSKRPAGKLSWGQQQRVALVRALCQPFKLLILDEPISHLDEATALLCAELVDREASRQHAAVLTTSVGIDLHLPGERTLNL